MYTLTPKVSNLSTSHACFGIVVGNHCTLKIKPTDVKRTCKPHTERPALLKLEAEPFSDNHPNTAPLNTIRAAAAASAKV